MGKSKLPPYVYRGRSAHEYKPYRGVGVARPTIRLCPLDATMSEVWAAWEALQATDEHGTLRWLLLEYQKSPEFKARRGRAKSKRTVDEQDRIIESLLKMPTRSGVPFVSRELRRVTPGVIRQLLDKRAADGAATMGNREVSLIQTAWNWARARDIVILPNPCVGVDKNAEVRRDRYVTDAEFDAIYKRATGAWYLRPAMELAYLCLLRLNEVLGLTWADVSDEGVRCARLKGSRTTHVTWSPRLREAVDQCKAAAGQGVGAARLFRDAHAVPIKSSTFHTAWQRLMVAAAEDGLQRFRFHDLKAKGVSDRDSRKGEAGGWRQLSMVDRYDRKPHVVEPTR